MSYVNLAGIAGRRFDVSGADAVYVDVYRGGTFEWAKRPGTRDVHVMLVGASSKSLGPPRNGLCVVVSVCDKVDDS